MRTAAKLVLAFLVSALATLGLISLLLAARPHLTRLLSAHAPHEAPAGESYGEAHRLVAAGRLRDAQDEYVGALARHPGDQAAMRGLVAVRRAMAGDDAALLKKQAVAYQQLAARGAETPEHYTAASLTVLAAASLQAATAIEADRRAALEAGAGRGSDPRRAAPRGARVSRIDAARRTPAAPAASNSKPSSTAAAEPRPGSAASPPAAAPDLAGAAHATHETEAAPAPAAPPAPAQPAPGQPGRTTTGAPAAPPAPPETTVGIVAPPAEPSTVRSQGDLVKVDCQGGRLLIHGPNGDEEFGTGPSTAIYVRGVTSERIAGVCGLEPHIGQTVIVWSVAQGDGRRATSITIVAAGEHGS